MYYSVRIIIIHLLLFLQYQKSIVYTLQLQSNTKIVTGIWTNHTSNQCILIKGVNIIYIMELVRQRQRKNLENARKKHREEIMSERREWFQAPSPVFQLPFRFQNQEWSDFELMLDSFGEKEISLVDQAFRSYLLSQWAAFHDAEWDNEKAFNILRVLFRLQLASKEHMTSLLNWALQAKKVYDETSCIRAVTVLLKILKQITISLQTVQSSKLWEVQALDCLNFIVSSLQLCRQFVQRNDASFTALFDDYRIYYIVLLVQKRVNLQQFVKIRNVGQLYYLINDCICQSDSYQLSKSIQLISKIIKIKGNQEVAKCLQGVSVLLIEGIESARLFLEDKPYQKMNQGLFFRRFLSVLGNSDVVNLLGGIELLALLFDQFDQCISAALSIHNEIDHPKEDSNSRIQVIRERQYESYTQLIESLMENIAYEVRLKTYWLVSNITGSSVYYRQFGLPIITHMYNNHYLILERENQPITNEITICLLNYLCNLSQPLEVSQLLQIYPPNTAKDVNTPSNCLVFCLEATLDMMQKICLSGDKRSNIYLDSNIINMIHRSVYALFMVFQHSETNEQMIVQLLECANCKLSLQKLYNSLLTHKQHEQLCDLTWSVLSKFQIKQLAV